jgi:Auxin binding protein
MHVCRASEQITSLVLHHADLPQVSLSGLEHRTLASDAHGLRSLSIWQQTLSPGLGELHLHGQIHRFGPNTGVVIARNVAHQIINVGDEPMKITAALATGSVEVFGQDDQRIELPW